MNAKRQYSAFMAAALILLTGCQQAQLSDNPSTTASDKSASAASDTSAAAAETEYIAPELEAIDCKGRNYTILSRGNAGYCFPYDEFYIEDQNGDVINDALFKRNRAIEEKYNLNLVSVYDKNVLALTQKSVQAGSNDYDLVMPMIVDAFSLSLTGCVTAVNDIPNIDVTKPWWRTSMLEDTSICGENYFVSGDLNLSNLNAVGVTYFNKSLAEKKGITDIYQTVRDGKWTLDSFMKYCKGVTEDINGDTVYNGEDAFGLTCNAFVWQPLFYGTDTMIITKDKDDVPHLAWDSEKVLSAVGKICTLLNDKSSTILVNQFAELKDAGGWGNASIKMFTEDRALFWIEIIYGVPTLRDMNTDFGLLPMPKYDESQEKYTSYVHCNHCSTCCVPVTNNELDLAGRILEDMAYQSYITVRPAYYNVTLKGKLSRDDESGEMLDIIYSNIKVDLTLAMSASGLPVDSSMRTAMIENRTDLVSMIAALKPSCETIIDKNVETIRGLMK